jgi:hypothetical protein
LPSCTTPSPRWNCLRTNNPPHSSRPTAFCPPTEFRLGAKHGGCNWQSVFVIVVRQGRIGKARLGFLAPAASTPDKIPGGERFHEKRRCWIPGIWSPGVACRTESAAARATSQAQTAAAAAAAAATLPCNLTHIYKIWPPSRCHPHRAALSACSVGISPALESAEAQTQRPADTAVPRQPSLWLEAPCPRVLPKNSSRATWAPARPETRGTRH